MTRADRRPRRLVLVTETLGMGGMEQVIVSMCRTIDRDRFAPAVLCLKRDGPMAEPLRELGVPVLRTSYDGRPDYTAFVEVASILRRHEADVVHTHNTCALLFGALGARLAGVRTVVHTDHARQFPDRRRIMLAEHVLSHLVTNVVGVSHHTTEALHRHERIPRRKLLTIPNGVVRQVAPSREAAARKRAELGVPDDALVVGLGARLLEQKGVDVLLEAVALLRDAHPRLHLVIAGDGPLREALTRRADALGIGERTRFLGMRRDMPELIPTFDVYALPSLWEGLPMAVLEAMAAGVPVVASDVGGVATAVEHGVTGSLVPPTQPAALAAALGELLADPARRARYGDAARQAYETRFTAEAMTRQYEALYLREPLRAAVPA